MIKFNKIKTALKKLKDKKLIRPIILGLVCALIISSGITVIYAYFSTRAVVYTNDGNKEYAKVGMRLDFLFDILNPDSVNTEDVLFTIKGKDNTEVSVNYDPTATWGTAKNPYIISDIRHLQNLSVLQGIEDDNGNNYFEQLFDTNSDLKSVPYFLVCNNDGTPVVINGDELNIKPIGDDKHPFVGYMGGSFKTGTAITPNNKESTVSVLANITVETTDDKVDVGLFGRIGNTSNDSGESDTINAPLAVVRDLLLYDVRIRVNAPTFTQKLANHIFTESQPPIDEDHHIGILVGHVDYALIEQISVYYSSNNIEALSVNQNGADYMSSSTILGYVDNLNPSFSVTTVSDGTQILTSYEKGTGTTIEVPVPSKAQDAGNEWGTSIDMQKMYDRLLTIENQSTSNYTSGKIISIDNRVISPTTGQPTEYLLSGTTGTITSNISGYSKVSSFDYANPTAGSFKFTKSDSSGSRYRYVTDFDLTYDETVYEFADSDKDAFYLGYENDGDVIYYVAEKSGNSVILTTTSGKPSTAGEVVSLSSQMDRVNMGGKWVIEKTNETDTTGDLSTIVDGELWYLILDGSDLAVTDTKPNMKWGKDNLGLYYLDGNQDKIHITRQYTTHYLKVGSLFLRASANENAAVSGTTDVNEATVWHLDQNGYYTMSNNNTRLYLSASQSYTDTGTQNSTTRTYKYSLSLNSNPTYKIKALNNNTLGLENVLNTQTLRRGVVQDSSYATYTLADMLGALSLEPNYAARTGYTFKSGSNYLAHGSGEGAVTNATSANDPSAIWLLEGNNYYFTNNGVKYYLCYNNNTVYTSANPSSYFTLNSNKLRVNTGGIVPSYRYIRYQNGWTTATIQNQGATFTRTQAGTSSTAYATPQAENFPLEVVLIEEAGLKRRDYSKRSTTYGEDRGTWFPLSAYVDQESADEDSNSIYRKLYASTDVNTGYVVSGTNNQYGDIRVSSYGKSDISKSVTTNESYDNMRVYTYNGSNVVQITDASSFNKYKDSREQFIETLKGDRNNYIYGLHFMNAEIGINNIAIADEVRINGRTYYNYELPKDTIDFNLKDDGYINFFAGTYYSNNDTFFSLHQIVRDPSDNHITEIREIKKIFNNPEYGRVKDAPQYIYYCDDNHYYKGNTASSSLPTGAQQVFDMSWVTNKNGNGTYYNIASTNNTSYHNAVFYFEIPVNSGEYALGSVDGGTGAYLMYLDIGTSGVEIDISETGNGALGTIDFVYDYDNKIITVNKSNGTPYTIANHNYQYYYPTKRTVYTNNYGMLQDSKGKLTPSASNDMRVTNFVVIVNRVIDSDDKKLRVYCTMQENARSFLVYPGRDNKNVAKVLDVLEELQLSSG